MTGTPGVDPPDWLAEIEPAPGPPFLAMGVRALAPGHWLTPGDAAARDAKRAVLAAHRDEVLMALPGTADPVTELVEAVGRDVGDDVAVPPPEPGTAAPAGTEGTAATGPAGARPATAARRAVAAGDTPQAGTTGALERAALEVAEDLCLLVRDGAHWVLGAACVCFPSHWRPADKLGRPVVEIHAPVPHYAGELATRVDRFIDRLTPGRGAWRRNWLVHTDDRLFAPVPSPPPEPPLTAGDAGARLWLRSERQTLRRLPATDAVAFTIRTQQVPLAVVAARPELRARLAAAVATWSDELVAYRGGEALRGPLLAWLQAGGGS